MLGNVFITAAAPSPFAVAPAVSFNWLVSAAVALNLLMLGVLLLTLLRGRRHVEGMLLVLGVVAFSKFVAAAMLLKSWALLLWLNSEAVLGIFIGLFLLVLANRLTRMHLLWFGATITLCYLVLAHGILDSGSPSASLRLYHWHYGHMLNYNGLSQTIALAFPLLLLIYLWRIRIR